jgi:hypothetical protein
MIMRILSSLLVLLAPLPVLAGSGTGGGNALPTGLPTHFFFGPQQQGGMNYNGDYQWVAQTGVPFDVEYTYITNGPDPSYTTGLIQNFMANAYAQNTIPDLVPYICASNPACNGSSVSAGNAGLVQGYISGTTFTVTSVTNGVVAVGEEVQNHLTGGLTISAEGTGTGGTGTYTLSGSATVCSSGSPCYFFVGNGLTAYFNNLASVASIAAAEAGTKPFIIHVEPDMFSELMQVTDVSCYSNGTSQASNTVSGLNISSVTSSTGYTGSSAVPLTGFPNTIAGFSQATMAVLRHYAPHAIVAMDFSNWACSGSFWTDTNASDLSSQGTYFGQFWAALAGNGEPIPDLLGFNAADRTCGCQITGCTNVGANTILEYCASLQKVNDLAFLQAFYTASGGRSYLWSQVGGSSQYSDVDNQSNMYQDNWTQYFLTPSNRTPAYPYGVNIEAWANAGVVGAVFGAGQPLEGGVTTYDMYYGVACVPQVSAASWSSTSGGQISVTLANSNINGVAGGLPWTLPAGSTVLLTEAGTGTSNYAGTYTVATTHNRTQSSDSTPVQVVLTAPTNPGTFSNTGTLYFIGNPPSINGNVLQAQYPDCDGGTFRTLAGKYYSLGAMPIQ